MTIAVVYSRPPTATTNPTIDQCNATPRLLQGPNARIQSVVSTSSHSERIGGPINGSGRNKCTKKTLILCDNARLPCTHSSRLESEKTEGPLIAIQWIGTMSYSHVVRYACYYIDLSFWYLMECQAIFTVRRRGRKEGVWWIESGRGHAMGS